MASTVEKVLKLGRQFIDLMRTADGSNKTALRFKSFGAPNFQGGPATKFGQLSQFTAKKGEKFHSLILLSSVTVPLFLVKVLKKRGVKVLVNQNGVFYPSWFSGDYKKKNAYLKKLNALADHTFFQSEFARQSYLDWVGRVPVSQSVLYNPIDVNAYFPKVESKKNFQVLVFLDVSTFTKPIWMYWKDVFAKLSNELSPTLQWILMGRILDQNVFEELQLPVKDPNVETFFNPTSTVLLETLQKSSVSLHLVHNDVCPNKVLEALACGTPVICPSAGGSAELVGNAGVVLSVKGGYDGPQFPALVDLKKAFDKVLQERDELSKLARLRAEILSLENWKNVMSKIAGAEG